MRDVVIRATQPAVGAIKLAWWRERLERLDQGSVPAEPRLQAAARELLPRGVSGAALAELEDGWTALFEEELDMERVGERGAKLFQLAATLLDEGSQQLNPAGRLFAFEQASRIRLAHVHSPVKELESLAGYRFPRRLRPLTAFARLAARDARKAPEFELEGTPGRAAALIAHRLTGRI